MTGESLLVRYRVCLIATTSGSARRLPDKLNHYIEAFIRVMDQNVFLPDRGKAVALIVAYPLREACSEPAEQKIRALLGDQLIYVHQRNKFGNGKNILQIDLQLAVRNSRISSGRPASSVSRIADPRRRLRMAAS